MCAVDGAGGSTASSRSTVASRSGLLRREPRLRPRGRERRRAEPEEAVAPVLEPLGEPRRALLRAAVLGEPARELLGRLLGLELGELGVLVGEERRAPSARAARRSGRGTRRRRRGRARRARRGARRTRARSRRGRPRAAAARRAGRARAGGRTAPRTRRGRARARRRGSAATCGRLTAAPDAALRDGHLRRPSALRRGARTRGTVAAGSPPRPRHCHQTKNAVEPTKSTIETHAFSRSGPNSCAWSTRSSSSKKRPKRVVGDVEREQRRRPDRPAPADPDQEQRRRRGPRSARRGTSGGRSRSPRYCAVRCAGSISSPHGRSVGLPYSSWLNQLPIRPMPCASSRPGATASIISVPDAPGAADDPDADERPEQDPAPDAEAALPDLERRPSTSGRAPRSTR